MEKNACGVREVGERRRRRGREKQRNLLTDRCNHAESVGKVLPVKMKLGTYRFITPGRDVDAKQIPDPKHGLSTGLRQSLLVPLNDLRVEISSEIRHPVPVERERESGYFGDDLNWRRLTKGLGQRRTRQTRRTLL